MDLAPIIDRFRHNAEAIYHLAQGVSETQARQGEAQQRGHHRPQRVDAEKQSAGAPDDDGKGDRPGPVPVLAL